MLICNKFTVYLIGIIFNKKNFQKTLKKKEKFPKIMKDMHTYLVKRVWVGGPEEYILAYTLSWLM